eukprot:GHVU01129810.1.p1 GENE.GHVU01129810.1~~GHVU01129810.1.p1  ORF type:complete len:102 (+),score=5.62 GHVU01129810.1:148-453(+)
MGSNACCQLRRGAPTAQCRYVYTTSFSPGAGYSGVVGPTQVSVVNHIVLEKKNSDSANVGGAIPPQLSHNCHGTVHEERTCRATDADEPSERRNNPGRSGR